MSEATLFPPLSYPRPRLWRSSFLSLDGEWDFAITKNEALASYGQKIRVPFPPESTLSGIAQGHEKGDLLQYRRKVVLPDGFHKVKTLLHFEAVDGEARVYWNGTLLGVHAGGYLPFTFDISALIEDENELSVCVKDDLDHAFPYGKQRIRRGGMWYTPFSALWGSVWLESFAEGGIYGIDVRSDEQSVTLSVDCDVPVTLTYRDGDREMTHTFQKEITLTPSQPHLWSPDDPFLYHVTLKTEGDEAKSYFALRRIEVGKANGQSRVLLNGKPIFLHGILDQGYFEKGISTPPFPDAYEKDILRMKELGFNMLRKHIKLESEVYYSLCDRHGMVVCQDAVNNGTYSFFFQTALPTVFMKRFPAFLQIKSRKAKRIFAAHTEAMLDRLAFHPSLLLFTIFNEGWGQSDPKPLYRHLKKKFPFLLFDSASGWFRTKHSDFRSDHVYFKRVRARYGKVKKPVFLSEFGGYSLPIASHLFPSGKNYGYTVCKDQKELEDKLLRLYLNEICPAIAKGLSAAVYTQLSDVEDETNGLYTYDREVLKVSPAVMDRIKNEIERAFALAVKEN